MTIRILVLNPNSSHEMTRGVAEAAQSFGLPSSLEVNTYTAPESSPASIDDDKDLARSTEAVLSDVGSRLNFTDYDAILVACYSVHPLVAKLRESCHSNALVLGIFESSILTSLALLPPYTIQGASQPKWGIVTTGQFWEAHLHEGVRAFLGQEPGTGNAKFAGVYSTGLVASDFHGGISQDVIRQKLKDATKRLLANSDVSCVVMGCAGMAGLEMIIRGAAIEEYGAEVGSSVAIIDGIKAGIGLLEQAVKTRRIFQS